MRLLAVLDRGAAGLFQAELAVEHLLGQRQRGAGLLVVGKSLREIAGIEHQKLLPLSNTLAELHRQADDAPGDRRQDVDGAAGIGLDDGRQDDVALDVFDGHRLDGEPRAHR